MCPPAGTSARSIVVALFMPLDASKQSSAHSRACSPPRSHSCQTDIITLADSNPLHTPGPVPPQNLTAVRRHSANWQTICCALQGLLSPKEKSSTSACVQHISQFSSWQTAMSTLAATISMLAVSISAGWQTAISVLADSDQDIGRQLRAHWQTAISRLAGS